MSRTPKDQLVHFLADMYSVEQQALVQLVDAPSIAGDESLAATFAQHYGETEVQAALVGERLRELGGSPSVVQNAVMKLGGRSFVLFARLQPDTPGRLLTHSYSYEAMEWAGYELPWRFAQHADDPAFAQVARRIGAEELAMMNRLEQSFGAAERASHGDISHETLPEQIIKHLAEAHALEKQGVKLFEKSEEIGGNAELNALYEQLRGESSRTAQFIERRMRELDSSPSTWKDAALALGAVNWVCSSNHSPIRPRNSPRLFTRSSTTNAAATNC